MINNLYCTFDKVTGKYSAPTHHNLDKDQALESVSDAVKVGQVPNAESLEFYFVGTFDTKTGLYDTCKPEFIAYLGDFIDNGKKE